MNAPPFRVRVFERAAWDRCLADDDVRTVGAGMAARWFGKRIKAPRHAWRPYPRRPGWLLCPRCGARVDVDPWGLGGRSVYYDRRGDFVSPDEYREPPCTRLPGYRLRVLWYRPRVLWYRLVLAARRLRAGAP